MAAQAPPPPPAPKGFSLQQKADTFQAILQIYMFILLHQDMDYKHSVWVAGVFVTAGIVLFEDDSWWKKLIEVELNIGILIGYILLPHEGLISGLNIAWVFLIVLIIWNGSDLFHYIWLKLYAGIKFAKEY